MNGYIIGLDPGSKVGYAVLDLEGNLIEVDSFKGGIDRTISEIHKHGKVLLIGTDVMRVPKFVKKVSSQLGARVIAPEYDLLYCEKKKKTNRYLRKINIKLKDRHQLAALAAALIAYRQVKGLFNKIDNEIKDESVSSKVKSLVLIENIPIKHALKKVY
ncbi:MAG: DUF460 domain-containing protein [Nanoarchaeota archaeon]